MYKNFYVLSVIIFSFIVISACASSGTLNTKALTESAEQDGEAVLYEPVKKETAIEAIPYKAEFPAYIPFEHEETEVFIADWKNNQKDIVFWMQYHSTEGETDWEGKPSDQQLNPYVIYGVSNFDLSYSRSQELSVPATEEIAINDEVTGLFSTTEKMGSAKLHWFHNGMERSIELHHFSSDKEEMKAELIEIANSI